MGKDEGIRHGDIEALRNRKALEGRPIKSTMIREKGHNTFYEVSKDGNVNIVEKMESNPNQTESGQ